MSELWGNGGKVYADGSIYSRVKLGDGIMSNDKKDRSSAAMNNAVFVKALWREIEAIQRRRA